VVDRELCLVAATDQAWRWIGRLGMAPANDVEPLPGFIYAVAARAAGAGDHPRRQARVRLRTADGHWAVVRVAPLTRGPQAGHGYAITLEPARSEDLAPLLMRAWALTPREREVARLVIDGLSSDDIAAALFISANTVRDRLKAIFGKVGVSRRRDLAATLPGRPPAGMEVPDSD
jgi:DNA-binding CsgD family transcriptional regulator